VYVVDGHNTRVQRFTAAGSFVLSWATAEGAFGVAIDSTSTVYVVSYAAPGYLYEYSAAGGLLPVS
jgi:hypothetical protein